MASSSIEGVAISSVDVRERLPELKSSLKDAIKRKSDPDITSLLQEFLSASMALNKDCLEALQEPKGLTEDTSTENNNCCLDVSTRPSQPSQKCPDVFERSSKPFEDVDVARLAIDMTHDNDFMESLERFVAEKPNETKSNGAREFEAALRRLDLEKYRAKPYFVILEWLSSLVSFCGEASPKPPPIEGGNGSSPADKTTFHLEMQGTEKCAKKSDVITDILRLSSKHKKTAADDYRFRVEYEELSADLQQLAADLVEEVRSEEELAIVMDTNGKGALTVGLQDKLKMQRAEEEQYLNSVTVLKNAAAMGLKTFVANPKCQHVLHMIIEAPEHSPSEHSSGSSCDEGFSKFNYCFSTLKSHPIGFIIWCALSALFHALAFSVYFIVFTFFSLLRLFSCNHCKPTGCRSTMDRVQHPYYKFINHTIFYAVFLSMVFASAFKNQFDIKSIHGNSNLYSCILVFVVGHFAEVITKFFLFFDCCAKKQCKPNTTSESYTSGYHLALCASTSMIFLASFILWIIAWKENNDSWNPADQLFQNADICYSIASVMCFLRITRILRAHRRLGTLEVSLMNMLEDLFYFAILFFFLFISFATGLRKLYSYHGTASKTSHRLGEFLPTMENLFWLIMGSIDMREFEADTPDYRVVQDVGRVMVIAYTILAVIIAINMLIAIMTKTFDTIHTNQNAEWPFARTQMWLEYLDYRGTVLPPPLNLLELILQLFQCFHKCCCKDTTDSAGDDANSDYETVRQYTVQMLVFRYLKKKLQKCQTSEENCHLTRKVEILTAKLEKLLGTPEMRQSLAAAKE